MLEMGKGSGVMLMIEFKGRDKIFHLCGVGKKMKRALSAATATHGVFSPI